MQRVVLPFMNQLNDISLITLSAFATIGIVCSVALICVFICHYREKHLVAQYRGLVKDITGTSHRMIQTLNSRGEQNAEFRWGVEVLSNIARTREFKGDVTLDLKLEEWREFFKHDRPTQ
jgi:hypothetical protein